MLYQNRIAPACEEGSTQMTFYFSHYSSMNFLQPEQNYYTMYYQAAASGMLLLVVMLPSTESLVSSDLSWKITPNDQDAGGACLLLLSYRLYVLLQICCTKHLKLSGVPGFQLWTIHIHISLHVEWIVSTSCNLVLVGKGKWNNANDGRKIERLTYPTILHYTDSLIQIIIFASTLLVLTFLNSTWGSFTNHGPAMVVVSLQKGHNAWSSNLLLHFSYSLLNDLIHIWWSTMLILPKILCNLHYKYVYSG